METCRPITLLTDFGTDDPYVGIMKGVILGIHPQARIVDLCHNVPSYDIPRAAFLLSISYPFFPPQSIHMVIVDPGVGSPRRPLLAVAKDQYFLAPDNGVLSYIFEDKGWGEVLEISSTAYFLPSVSSTFHGRDLFAPVAAHLSRGARASEFGSAIADFVKIQLPRPSLSPEGELVGEILHVDRFGNLITNITLEDLRQLGVPGQEVLLTLNLGASSICGLKSFYGQAEPGKPAVIIGSSGHLEIFVNQGRADVTIQGRRGDPLTVVGRSRGGSLA